MSLAGPPGWVCTVAGMVSDTEKCSVAVTAPRASLGQRGLGLTDLGAFLFS